MCIRDRSCIIGPESVFAFRQKFHWFPRENWCKSGRESSSFQQIMLILSQVSCFGNSLSWTTSRFVWIIFCHIALIPLAATHKFRDGGILESSMTLRNHEKKKIQMHIWDDYFLNSFLNHSLQTFLSLIEESYYWLFTEVSGHYTINLAYRRFRNNVKLFNTSLNAQVPFHLCTMWLLIFTNCTENPLF